MNKSTLPIGFWEWLFDVTDGECLANYDRYDFSAEYGISKSDYLNQYNKEAIIDAQNYFDSLTLLDRTNTLKNYINSCQNKIEIIQKDIKQIQSLLP